MAEPRPPPNLDAIEALVSKAGLRQRRVARELAPGFRSQLAPSAQSANGEKRIIAAAPGDRLVKGAFRAGLGCKPAPRRRPPGGKGQKRGA